MQKGRVTCQRVPATKRPPNRTNDGLSLRSSDRLTGAAFYPARHQWRRTSQRQGREKDDSVLEPATHNPTRDEQGQNRMSSPARTSNGRNRWRDWNGAVHSVWLKKESKHPPDKIFVLKSWWLKSTTLRENHQ